jgi:tetratricopeptide (TPR) repeat protein
VRRYGINKFKDFWQIATDLTAGRDLMTVYGISADWLIGDWEQYLDTLKIDPGLFQYHSQRDAQVRDYREAVRLLMMRYGAIGGDRKLLKDIGNYYYLLGNYEKAQEFFGKVLLQDSVRVSDLLTYANMLLMNGRLDSALTWYGEVVRQDSTQNLPYYKIGKIYQYRGDTEKAMEYFRKAASLTEDIDIVIDAQLGIGECFREFGDEDSAQAYFVSALNGSKLMMVGGNPRPLAIMRAGEAFLQLDQPQAAIDHLEFAIFVEERLFYIARMSLALGEAYDLIGNRDAAIDSYELTKSAPGGFLYREEADKYISKPFTLNP